MKKIRVKVSLPVDLVSEAKLLGINLSRAAEQEIAKAVSDQKARLRDPAAKNHTTQEV